MFLLNAEVGYMTAMAAIHSHMKADFDKAATQTTNMWFNALANVPYVTGGATGKDALTAEREKAVEQYKRWKLQEKTPPGADKLTPKENTE